MKEYKPLFVTTTAEAALAIIDGVDGTGAEVLPLDNPENMAAFMEYQEDRVPVILAFDRTGEGKDAAARIRKTAPAGWPIWNTAGSLCGDYDSIANAAKKDAAGFVRNITEAVRRLYEVADAAGYFDEPKAGAAPDPKDPLADFLQEIQTRKYEPISTGIKDIDRALYGGFLRGTLVTLGAAPGAGKTYLAQWIFESIAAAGLDVIFINLEMDRAQLLARSLARIAWQRSGPEVNVSALDVLRGYEWTPAQADAIQSAAKEYREKIAPRCQYNPATLSGSNDIEAILNALEAETKKIKDAGRPAPFVCIDYLQIITTERKDAAEDAKQIVRRLKDFAIRNNTVVFLITAQNRAANTAGRADMESGRDTSAIEYSGDLMLGLVYTAIEDGETWTYYERDEDGKILQDKSGNPKKVIKVYDLDRIRALRRQAYEAGTSPDPVCSRLSLKVLKNRFGASDRRANFIFDGEHGTFRQIEHAGRPDPERRDTWQQADFSDISAAF